MERSVWKFSKIFFQEKKSCIVYIQPQMIGYRPLIFNSIRSHKYSASHTHIVQSITMIHYEKCVAYSTQVRLNLCIAYSITIGFRQPCVFICTTIICICIANWTLIWLGLHMAYPTLVQLTYSMCCSSGCSLRKEYGQGTF
jgi:hypothetical protein